LLDVYTIGAFRAVALIGRLALSALGSASIGTAAAAVEMPAAALIMIHRHRVSTF
jgi:hypothetical protein